MRRAGLDFPGALAALAPEAAFRAWLRSLYRQPWVVYAKPPFGSPAHVLHYLARYTHRVAISNHRLVDVTDDTVSFRWKDYRHGSQITHADARRRRVSPPLPPARAARSASSASATSGFSPRACRTRELAQCRQALAVAPPPPAEPPATAAPRASWPCPRCGAPMRLVERLTARQLFLAALLADILHDTS